MLSSAPAPPHPRVSVVMPVYNGARFLEAAVSSVLAQSMADLELVVVDDGSTDETPAVLARFAAQDPRVVLVTRQRGGIVAALNAGLARATAPLIARMDADDVMTPDRLSRQLAFLDEHPELVGVASDYELIDEKGASRGAVRSPLRSVDAVEAYMRRGLPVVFAHPTVLVQKAAVEQVGGYRADYRDSEDVDLFTRLIDSGRHIVVQPEELLRLRVHGHSISAGATRRQLMLNDLIVLNSARRRSAEPEMSVDEYAAGHLSSPSEKLDFERRLLRAKLLRQATVHRREGRRVAQVMVLGLVLLIGPGRTVSAAVRRVRSWSSRRRVTV
ncbi:glycosyltransferase family 2 protein [Modestobacter sp. SSW1-42]|uniref:glycosyltransferase family 2 protein n=1 Tax=Modestobacter sp. SSW1-42 TaxID=596372 RepID=UPI003986C9DF